MSKFMSSNMASSSGSGILPGNTVTNLKEDLKGITTRSGVVYQGPTIPTPSKVVKQGTEATKDPVQTPSPQSTTHVQPSVTQSETLVSEPIAAPVSALMPNLKPSIPYLLRRENERRHEQANEQIEKFYEIFKDMSFEISFTDALILMPKFASNLKALIGSKEKLSEMARTLMNEHCSAVILNKLPKKLGDPDKFLIPCEFPGMDECLALADLSASINLMPLSVSPVHCVPKKGGFTVIKNEENELIPTRLVTDWRVCIDYRKLNEATHKDHFPLPFMDQMLERLAGNEYYCFLDGFSGYFQIPIDPHDQEKTTFTRPYGTFAYRRMPFGLCNAPRTFQRCMLAIFHDMVEKTFEVFMDDFSVFGNSFETCLSRLDKMLQSGVCTAKKLSTFSKLATMGPWGDIMVLTTLPKRIPSKFVKSLTFGVLILWARSHLHRGTNTFSWTSIICPNGLKRKRFPQMTPELFASFSNLSSPDLVPLELS
nr:reverse transcriptase domain-containing protein [Tanacetum cinerariifolium]